jgi:hypothetical protein
MDPTAKALCTIAPVAMALTATLTAAAAQQRVTVYADEAPYATGQAVTYEFTCPSGKYRLRFNQNDHRVEFDSESQTRTTVDLSTTPFGVNFLGKGLHGKFYSTCPKPGGIRVYFYGIEPKTGPTLKPVKYRVTIGSDGVVTDDGGLVEESPEGINFTFLRKFQQ